MSHVPHMVSDNRKHQRPIYDVERAAGGNISSSGPYLGAWPDALDTKVAAVGEGPAGEARSPRFSRSLRESWYPRNPDPGITT